MIKRTRTILFWTCVFLFFIVAPSTVLYSQGYRIDFTEKKITQTGGLFLKALPKQAEVYLDGKLKDKTDFLFGSILIENLLPKKYKIEIKKTGFQLWEKTLETKEKEVTEARNIVLFPQDPSFITLSRNVENYWFSPDGKKIILKESEQKAWALKLYDLEKNVKSYLIGENTISKKGVDLINVQFSEDAKEIILKTGIDEELKYFSLSLEKTPPLLTEKVSTTSSENIIASKKIGNDAYYLDSSGYLFKNKEELTETPLKTKQETEYVLEVFQNLVFLKENEILYQFNQNSKAFEKFFEDIRDFKISPNAKKLVYYSNSEIWILFLKDDLVQPQRKAGEKILLSRLSEKINDILWLNSDYLLLNIGNKIKITEIDNRDKINTYDLAEFENPQIFFNKTDKKLYILSSGDFLVSQILLP